MKASIYPLFLVSCLFFFLLSATVIDYIFESSTFSGLQLHEQADDRHVVRYVYYYLARVLAESGSHGITPGGGVPTPNWDALATLNVAGAVTRADVVPQIVERLAVEAANIDPAGDVL